MHRLIVSLLFLTCACHASAQSRLVGDLPRRDNKPLVELPGLETEYGVVRTSEGTRLRSILTRPNGTTGRLPAIMLAQWVSCASLDAPATRPSLMRELAEKSGMVFVRIERSGTGDSARYSPESKYAVRESQSHTRRGQLVVARSPISSARSCSVA